MIDQITLMAAQVLDQIHNYVEFVPPVVSQANNFRL
jgi:hypothetical protein